MTDSGPGSPLSSDGALTREPPVSNWSTSRTHAMHAARPGPLRMYLPIFVKLITDLCYRALNNRRQMQSL